MVRRGVKKSTVYRFIALLLIKILHDYLTVSILDGLWYVGYGSYGIDFNWSKEIISFAVFIPFTVYLVTRFREYSFINVFIYGVYAVYCIPLNSAYAINNTSNGFFILSSAFTFLMLCLCSTSIRIDGLKIRGKRRKRAATGKEKQYVSFLDKPTVRIVCFILCILCFVYKIMYNGLGFSLNIFSDTLYDARAAYVDSMDLLSGSLLAYILTIVKNLSGCVAPFYLYYGLKRKNVAAVVASIICLLSLFSISAGKGTLLFLAVVAVIMWCEKRRKLHRFIDLMLLGILAGLMVCLIVYKINHSYKLYFLIFRREMYYPAWLNTLYYDFFHDNPKVWYSQGTFLLQKIIPSSYNQTPIQLISAKYFNSAVASPNTGMFADAYMNMGGVGVVLFPVMLSFLLKKTEKVYSFYGDAISTLMAVKLILVLTNIPIFRTDTVLSFWLMTIMLFVLPKFYFRKQ